MTERVIAGALQILMCGWMAWTWLRFPRTYSTEFHNSWRGTVALIALLAASFSLCDVVALSVRAHFHGGFRYMAMAQLWWLFAGLLVAPIAVACALAGKGSARWTSLLCGLFSLVALMVEFRAE